MFAVLELLAVPQVVVVNSVSFPICLLLLGLGLGRELPLGLRCEAAQGEGLQGVVLGLLSAGGRERPLPGHVD